MSFFFGGNTQLHVFGIVLSTGVKFKFTNNFGDGNLEANSLNSLPEENA